MSVRRLAAAALQPPAFTFTPENSAWADREIAKYPEGRQASAVIPLLWRAQEQGGGWVSEAAIRHVALALGLPFIRVLEIATFYTMFALEPVGRHFVQLCGTTPCALRGANDLKTVCLDKIGPQSTVTADGALSWLEVECLGACCNAPMVQINYDYYEDLTPESFATLLDDLSAGRTVKPGPQNGRRASEPQDAVTTLTDPSLYDGSVVGSWKARFEDETRKADAKKAEEKKAADAKAAAEAATKPETGKPAETRTEQQVADTPAHRAASGKEPVKAEDRAAASDPKTSSAVKTASVIKTSSAVKPGKE